MIFSAPPDPYALWYQQDDAVGFATSYSRHSRDDERFIRACEQSGRTASVINYRALFLWRILRLHYRSYPSRNINLLWLALLDGEDDVWLWVDGDEDFLAARASDWITDETLRPDRQLWNLVGRALKTRQRTYSRNMYLQRRVETAENQPIRFAMITWLVLTSNIVKAADAEQGLSDREQWNLRGLISEWYLTAVLFPCPSQLKVPEDFENAMNAARHTCHLANWESAVDHEVTAWLYVRSLLFPDRASQPINLLDSLQDIQPQCEGCFIHACGYVTIERASIPGNSIWLSPPSPYLVFLKILHSRTETYKWHESDFCKWVSRFSHEIFHHTHIPLSSVFGAVNTFLHEISCHPMEINYLPWVNCYPRAWRGHLTKVTVNEWVFAEASLANFRPSREPLDLENPDLSAWIAALVLLLIPKNVSAVERASSFLKIVTDDILLISQTPQQTAATARFQRAIEKSQHTCWNQCQAAWYAAGMTYLNETDDISVIGLEGSDCAACLRTEVKRILSATSDIHTQLSRVLKTMKEAYPKSFTYEIHAQANSNPRGDSDEAQVGIDDRNPSLDWHNMSSNPLADEERCLASESVESCPSVSDVNDDAGLTSVESAALQRWDQISPGKGTMIRIIKDFFISSLESQNIELDIILGKPKLPWTSLLFTLQSAGIEMLGWPDGVPLPGTGENDHKGISGMSAKHLKKIYLAINDQEHPLKFRRVTTGSGENHSELLDRIEKEQGQPLLQMPESDGSHAKRALGRSDDGRLAKKSKWFHYSAPA